MCTTKTDLCLIRISPESGRKILYNNQHEPESVKMQTVDDASSMIKNSVCIFGKLFADISCHPKSFYQRNASYSEYCFVEFSNIIEWQKRAESSTSENLGYLSLEEVFYFITKLQLFEKMNPGPRIIIRLGNDSLLWTRFVSIIGCYLIMLRGLGYEEALLVIQPLRILMPQGIGHDCPEYSMRAVCCAKCLNWINFVDLMGEDNEAELQMDEYIHNAR
jgi:hypothetical protein